MVTDSVEISLEIDKCLGVLRMSTQLVSHLVITTHQATTHTDTQIHSYRVTDRHMHTHRDIDTCTQRYRRYERYDDCLRHTFC